MGEKTKRVGGPVDAGGCLGLTLDREYERRITARLEELCGEDALLLHHRRHDTSSDLGGEIAHVAVTASGVYVLDARSYGPVTVWVRRTGGILNPVQERLMVAGRDRTKLLDSLARELARVTDAVGDGMVPVSALLCFLGADLPLVETVRVAGIPVMGTRGARRLLCRPGPVDVVQRRLIWERLVQALPLA